MTIVTIAAAINSKDDHAHQIMEDAAVLIAIEEVITTTVMTAVVMAIDDRRLQGAAIGEVLIGMMVDEEVDHVHRSDVVVDTGVLTVDTMTAALCLDEDLIRFRIYRSSHKSHPKGLFESRQVRRLNANNDIELSCNMSNKPSRHVASKPMSSC